MVSETDLYWLLAPHGTVT